MLVRRRRGARKGVCCVELDEAVEVLELVVRERRGELLIDLLSNACVSLLSRRNKCALLSADEDRNAESRFRKPARSPQEATADRVQKAELGCTICYVSFLVVFTTHFPAGAQPTGGDVVLNSSEATELVGAGVSGGIAAMN